MKLFHGLLHIFLCIIADKGKIPIKIKSFQELIHMEYKSIIKGAAVGMMAGTACYIISRSSDRKKKSLKRNATKAIKAFSNAVGCFSSMMG